MLAVLRGGAPRRVAISLCASFLLSAATAEAQQPSFECSQAESWADRTVCGDPELARLDREVAEHYDGLRRRLTGKLLTGLAEDRRVFQESRADCQEDPTGTVPTPEGCLRDAYQARLAQLRLYDRVLPGGESAEAGEPALPGCQAEVTSRQELVPCLERALAHAEGALTLVAGAIGQNMAELDQIAGEVQAEQAFHEAQQAFRRFREASCRWRRAAREEEGGGEESYQACLADMTRQRAHDLARTLP